MKKTIKKSTKKIALIGSIAFLSLSAAISTPFLLNAKNNEGNLLNGIIDSVNQNSKAPADVVNPLVPQNTYWNWPLLTAKTGPIVTYNNSISALDWYGKVLWEIDIAKHLPSGVNTGNMAPWFGRAFSNWDLDYNNSILYVLTNTVNSNSPKQKLLKIDVLTGNVESSFSIQSGLFFQIKYLSSNKVMLYALGSDSWSNIELYDVATNTSEVIPRNNELQHNVGSTITLKPAAQVRMNFIFSIAPNVNVVCLVDFGSGGQGPSDGSLYFALLDDKLGQIVTDTSSKWNKAVKMVHSVEPGSGYAFLRNSYTFQNGQRTFFTAKNKAFIIGTTYDSTTKELPMKIFDLGDETKNIIDSFTFDNNENLFFKYVNNSKINKLTFSGTNVSNTTFTTSTYYDLAGSPIPEIVSGASRFKLYNVYGYSGQIMLIESYQWKTLDNGPANSNSWGVGSPPDPTILGYPCGLSVGITNNINDSTQGDTKGLLNTNKAYQFSANFDIDNLILSSKLPSEITPNDLTLLNNSFYTSNPEKNPDGSLKYTPFLKTNIDDEKGTFSLQVNLDQIPWFTTILPNDYIPLTLTRDFTGATQISSRFSWKDVNNDYNILNSLPSEVTVEDMTKFDPFIININSNVVTDPTTGSILYPNKKYTLSDTNDTTGNIQVNIEYKYYPLGVQQIESNIKTFTTNKVYKIFSNTATRDFQWIGGNAGETNIETIPSLKAWSSANYLPSSLNPDNIDVLLSFVNVSDTKGYPLNKLTFKIESNDNDGTLTITCTSEVDSKTFTKKYVGFNKINQYSFLYQLPQGLTNLTSSTPATGIVTSKDYTKILPSNISILDIYNDFIKYTGYNSLDLNLSLSPNDNEGTLEVHFELTNTYPNILQTSNTFQNVSGKYISQIKLGNFLTTKQAQVEYDLTFVDNNDVILVEIKGLEPNVIINTVQSAAGLTIGGKTYKGFRELAELFIQTKGIQLPSLSTANVSFYAQNLSGELILKIEYPTLLSYPLIFTQTFTGFAQGVAVPTADSFVFHSESTINQDLFKRKASELAKELLANPVSALPQYVNFTSGQFNALITSANNFDLVVSSNDTYGSLNITIKFKNLTNSQTLKNYSIQYVGFEKVA